MPVRQQLHRMGAGAPACAICGQAGHGLHYCPKLTTSEGCVMWAAWDKKWLLLLGQELMRYALCSDDAEYRRRSAALFSKCVVDRAEVLAFRRQHGIKSTAAGDKAFKDTRPATRMFRAARKPLCVSSAQNVSAEARKAANRRRNQRRRNKRKGKSIATQADDPAAAMEMDREMPPPRGGRRTFNKISVGTSASPPPALLPAAPLPALLPALPSCGQLVPATGPLLPLPPSPPRLVQVQLVPQAEALFSASSRAFRPVSHQRV